MSISAPEQVVFRAHGSHPAAAGEAVPGTGAEALPFDALAALPRSLLESGAVSTIHLGSYKGGKYFHFWAEYDAEAHASHSAFAADSEALGFTAVADVTPAQCRVTALAAAAAAAAAPSVALVADAADSALATDKYLPRELYIAGQLHSVLSSVPVFLRRVQLAAPSAGSGAASRSAEHYLALDAVPGEPDPAADPTAKGGASLLWFAPHHGKNQCFFLLRVQPGAAAAASPAAPSPSGWRGGKWTASARAAAEGRVAAGKDAAGDGGWGRSPASSFGSARSGWGRDRDRGSRDSTGSGFGSGRGADGAAEGGAGGASASPLPPPSIAAGECYVIVTPFGSARERRGFKYILPMTAAAAAAAGTGGGPMPASHVPLAAAAISRDCVLPKSALWTAEAVPCAAAAAAAPPAAGTDGSGAAAAPTAPAAPAAAPAASCAWIFRSRSGDGDGGIEYLLDGSGVSRHGDALPAFTVAAIPRPMYHADAAGVLRLREDWAPRALRSGYALKDSCKLQHYAAALSGAAADSPDEAAALATTKASLDSEEAEGLTEATAAAAGAAGGDDDGPATGAAAAAAMPAPATLAPYKRFAAVADDLASPYVAVLSPRQTLIYIALRAAGTVAPAATAVPEPVVLFDAAGSNDTGSSSCADSASAAPVSAGDGPVAAASAPAARGPVVPYSLHAAAAFADRVLEPLQRSKGFGASVALRADESPGAAPLGSCWRPRVWGEPATPDNSELLPTCNLPGGIPSPHELPPHLHAVVGAIWLTPRAAMLCVPPGEGRIAWLRAAAMGKLALPSGVFGR